MKISTLIERLQSISAEKGDLEVSVLDPEAMENGDIVETTARIVIGESSDGAETVLLCDQETYLAFLET